MIPAKSHIAVTVIFLCFAQLLCESAAVGQGSGYGPEVRSFLELMRHEEDELDFQIKHNEISHKEYLLAKNRIAVQRQSVLSLVKQRGEDAVPEIHVVTAGELDQLIEQNPDDVKRAKPGQVFDDKWKYVGKAVRGEVFFVFERITVR
ncbi:MAG TPA: hypothetical protein VKM94_11270 [Blastocatellia bacterium]|nr:hypothetical protein [Blastocatellia bacterium]